MATKPKAAAPAQEVATTPKGGSLQEQTPDFMKKYAGEGTEKLTSADIETPRIKLLAALSPECEEYETAKPGVFWHSMLNLALGKSIKIVPIYVDMRAILWRPRHDGGGILARSDDGATWVPPNGEFVVKPKKDSQKQVTWRTKPSVTASGLLDWGSSDPSDASSQPAATRMYNMVVALPDNPELLPGVVTMQRGSIRAARKFLGQLKMVRAPSYGQIYTMESFLDENAKGEKYHNYKLTPEGFVGDERQFKAYQDLYEAFKRIGLKMSDLEGLQDEMPPDDADTAEPAGAPKY